MVPRLGQPGSVINRGRARYEFPKSLPCGLVVGNDFLLRNVLVADLPDDSLRKLPRVVGLSAGLASHNLRRLIPRSCMRRCLSIDPEISHCGDAAGSYPLGFV